MEYTPSRQRAKYIIKNVIKFKQPQSEIELTEFHKSAHPSGYEQHRPDRAPLQRICDDKSKREKKQDVIQDLHPQRNIFPEYPGFIGPERLQLIQTLRSRFPEGQRKSHDRPKLNCQAYESRRLPQAVKEPDVEPVHEKNVQHNKNCNKYEQFFVLTDI